MNPTLEAAVATLRDAIAAIENPTQRFQGLTDAEAAVLSAVRDARRQVANDLHDEGRSWREVGEVMGGVTAQRAYQIAQGK